MEPRKGSIAKSGCSDSYFRIQFYVTSTCTARLQTAVLLVCQQQLVKTINFEESCFESLETEREVQVDDVYDVIRNVNVEVSDFDR